MKLALLPILTSAILSSAAVAQSADPAGREKPAEPKWLEYAAADGPGEGRRIVLIAADQEYRSEQAMPMLARILAQRHGFACTVLFGVNEEGLVDPTRPVRHQDKTIVHDIPGLEKLREADLMILFSRMVTLPSAQVQHIIDYVDSGKPIIGIRTANHGFIGFPYKVDGKRVRFGQDVLGGSFRRHHGGWHREATRGIVVEDAREHPILRGVSDLWGPSDVYRTYPEGGALPESCTALVLGQPLVGRQPDDAPNEKKIPLPVAWTNAYVGSTGKPSRVFHTTMGSARDYQCADLRRMTINAAYWCLGLEDRVTPESSVDYVGEYDPLPSGFNYEKLGVAPRPVTSFR